MKYLKIITIALLLSAASFTRSFAQKFEELALTPPMGWNSWNTFQTNINEQMLRDMVDAYVSSGMKDAGYTYFVLDDGWMAMDRDANGSLVADPKKFPSGMKAFADYVHSKGLKFGIYNCAGTHTCAGYPPGCPPLCLMGCRLLKIRLVQYRQHKLPRCLPYHEQGHPCGRQANGFQSLRMGQPSALDLGKKCGAIMAHNK
jgi:hypothetical protein